jgi:hypothetical protein
MCSMSFNADEPPVHAATLAYLSIPSSHNQPSIHRVLGRLAWLFGVFMHIASFFLDFDMQLTVLVSTGEPNR